MTWHVENLTNIIISIESRTDANTEVRHVKNESGVIMNRHGTQTSDSAQVRKGALVKVASRQQCYGHLQIVANNTKPMAIEEIEKDKHA